MTHSENGTGNEIRGAIIHAEGVVWWEWRDKRYHPRPQACGVGIASSAPEARTVRAAKFGGLPYWREAFELVTEILEVFRADAQAEHLLDHGKEISQRTNRAQRRSICGPHQAARRRQQECVFDHAHGDAALVELQGHHSVRAADSPHRTRRFAIRFQNSANIFFLAAAVVHEDDLSLADRAATDRRWSPCGSSVADDLVAPPPLAGCPRSSATRHRQDS